jgi:hypothetical protein
MSTKKLPEPKISCEQDVVLVVTEFLAKLGYRVRHEVPNMGQSADLVATRGRWVTFIEAKMSNWSQAMSQCRAHEQVADFICLAVRCDEPSERLLEAVREAGYGLLGVSPQQGIVRWHLFPVRNLEIWAPQRRAMSINLREVSYASH